MPVMAQGRKALILSSLQKLAPLRNEDLETITRSVVSAGYSVTYLADQQVTVSVITSQLNKYDLVIWRTNTYDFGHIMYWYIGQSVSNAILQQYAPEFALKELDASHGIIGANLDFFQHHIRAGSLNRVKLAILVSSYSSSISNYLIGEGAKSVIEFCGSFSLQFGLVDTVTATLMYHLSSGDDVADAISATVTPYLTMQPTDPLDTVQIPPLAVAGDATVTIT